MIGNQTGKPGGQIAAVKPVVGDNTRLTGNQALPHSIKSTSQWRYKAHSCDHDPLCHHTLVFI
jgi:hypothetical protein